jgi:hypothetical protein
MIVPDGHCIPVGSSGPIRELLPRRRSRTGEREREASGVPPMNGICRRRHFANPLSTVQSRRSSKGQLVITPDCRICRTTAYFKGLDSGRLECRGGGIQGALFP